MSKASRLKGRRGRLCATSKLPATPRICRVGGRVSFEIHRHRMNKPPSFLQALKEEFVRFVRRKPEAPNSIRPDVSAKPAPKKQVTTQQVWLVVFGLVALYLFIWTLGRKETVLIPHRVIGTESSTRAKGQWQVEVDLVGGRLPNAAELEAVVKKLTEEAGGLASHERYYVEFYFPGMIEKNGGSKSAYALARLDPEEASGIQVRFHEDWQESWPARFQNLPVPSDGW